MSVRYVLPLTEQQRTLLENTMKNDAAHRARMRAHGLVLSSEGITIKAIAKIYHVDRDTVSTWIKQWEKHGAKSLTFPLCCFDQISCWFPRNTP